MLMRFTAVALAILLLPAIAGGQDEEKKESPPAVWGTPFTPEEPKSGDTGAAPEEDVEAEEDEAPVEGEEAPFEEEEEYTVEDEEPLPLKEPPIVEEPVFIGEEGEEEEIEKPQPKRIVIDTVVFVDYQFFNSTDAFKVKYHISMGGRANLATAVIKGSAEIATEVTGYLAKWPKGQCMLDISIARVPYEITYKQGGDEADINIEFKKDISEKWESTCTFIGGVTKPFKTQGPPEKWISEALEKASPPIGSIVAPVEPNESTSISFTISEYTVVEEGLGSAKVKGTGIVTIEPASKPATPETKPAP